jgi:hypothetical protein
MYIVDNEHVLTNIWLVRDYKFNKDDISCTLEKVPDSLSSDIVKTISSEDAEANKDQVLLFAKPALTKKLAQTGSITFDYHELDRIQVIDKDHNETISATLLIIIGSSVGIALVLLGLIFFIGYYFLIFA